MNIYFATGNRHKVKELRQFFAEADLSGVLLYSAGDLSVRSQIEETADTFEGNARLKAEFLKKLVPAESWVLADDSGLEVEALGGAPGVYSSRYAGQEVASVENNECLLRNLEGVEDRRARFVCTLVLLGPYGEEYVFEGVCSGRIIGESRGDGGFGYDPIFVPEGYDKTFAELGEKVKNQESHRGRAVCSLVEWLRVRGQGETVSFV